MIPTMPGLAAEKDRGDDPTAFDPAEVPTGDAPLEIIPDASS